MSRRTGGWEGQTRQAPSYERAPTPEVHDVAVRDEDCQKMEAKGTVRFRGNFELASAFAAEKIYFFFGPNPTLTSSDRLQTGKEDKIRGRRPSKPGQNPENAKQKKLKLSPQRTHAYY